MRAFAGAGLAVMVITSSAAAQATGLSTFSAPYRAFSQTEAGFSIIAPAGRFGGTAVEAMYRVARGDLDIGLRGGAWFHNFPLTDDIIVLGAEARQRVLTHSESFPADASLLVGVGAHVGGVNSFMVPIGVSFGRRIDIEDSDVSIVPFVQPTGWLVFGDNDGFDFGIGVGADFRLAPRFDLRLSAGLGDRDGVALGAVWIN